MLTSLRALRAALSCAFFEAFFQIRAGLQYKYSEPHLSKLLFLKDRWVTSRKYGEVAP